MTSDPRKMETPHSVKFDPNMNLGIEKVNLGNAIAIGSFQQPVGRWWIGDNFCIGLYKRPTDQQIKNTEELLGWKWEDAK